MMVDAGEHWVRATAPGQRAWEMRVAVRATRDRLRIDLPPWPAHPVHPSAGPSPEDTRPADHGKTTKTAAFLLAGTGAAALAVGGYFGVLAIRSRNSALDLCHGTTQCTDHDSLMKANDADARAGREALGSTIAMSAGAVTLGVGAALLIWGKPHSNSSASAVRTVIAAPLEGGGYFSFSSVF